MTAYHVLGLPDELTEEERRTRRSPQYGHPAHLEIAAGTGPCRACLAPFEVGEEERLLFTYRPAAGNGSQGAPGPVFIHARSCTPYRGSVMPQTLQSIPLLLEARAADGRIPSTHRVNTDGADAVLTRLFADPDVDFVYVRHGEAGCHIARVDRGPIPATAT